MKPHFPRVNPLERLILLSANEEGFIFADSARNSGARKYTKVLKLLENLHVLHGEPAENRFRLTTTGMKLREGLRSAAS